MEANKFIAKCNEVRELYVETKKVMILAENVDKDKDAYLMSLNELRNAFDHLMRILSISDEKEIEKQFSLIKDHVARAGYDTCEILALSLLEKIGQTVTIFPPDVLTNVFPQYYNEINPRFLRLQQELTQTRDGKREESSMVEYVNKYARVVDELREMSKVIDLNIPALVKEKERLEDAKNNNKKEKKGDRLVTFSFGFFFALLGIALKYGYDKLITPASATQKSISSDSINKNHPQIPVDSTLIDSIRRK
jgi:hypothetical protein